jgi:hypothetical protein
MGLYTAISKAAKEYSGPVSFEDDHMQKPGWGIALGVAVVLIIMTIVAI